MDNDQNIVVVQIFVNQALEYLDDKVINNLIYCDILSPRQTTLSILESSEEHDEIVNGIFRRVLDSILTVVELVDIDLMEWDSTIVVQGNISRRYKYVLITLQCRSTYISAACLQKALHTFNPVRFIDLAEVGHLMVGLKSRMSDDWTVEKILNFKQPAAIKLAKEWSVDIGGLQKLEEITDKLVEEYKKRRQPGIVQASKDQENIRIELQENFRKAKKLVGMLPSKLMTNMLQSYPNLEADIKARLNSLKTGECWILVTGEVGAGKSSIINLCLECQLLPVDALKSSNTIVEIRCSDIKEARCYFKPPLSDSGTSLHTEPRIIKMNVLRGIQEFKDCVAECDENDDNPYDHIELYYPFKTLSKNVVIVDTPGIKGGSNVDHRLQKYLKSAFGILYVINTNNARGVSYSRELSSIKFIV